MAAGSRRRRRGLRWRPTECPSPGPSPFVPHGEGRIRSRFYTLGRRVALAAYPIPPPQCGGGVDGPLRGTSKKAVGGEGLPVADGARTWVLQVAGTVEQANFAILVFFQGAPFPPKRPRNQPSPIPAARSCELRDRATGGETFGSGGRIGAVSGSIAKAGTGNRRAAGGGAGRLRRPHGGKGVCGESAILTVAEACNNTAASFAGRWTRRVGCNLMDD